jgi:hypothetical protein
MMTAIVDTAVEPVCWVRGRLSNIGVKKPKVNWATDVENLLYS